MIIELFDTTFGWSSKFNADNIHDIANDIGVYHCIRYVIRVLDRFRVDSHSKKYVAIVGVKYTYCEIS